MLIANSLNIAINKPGKLNLEKTLLKYFTRAIADTSSSFSLLEKKDSHEEDSGNDSFFFLFNLSENPNWNASLETYKSKKVSFDNPELPWTSFEDAQLKVLVNRFIDLRSKLFEKLRGFLHDQSLLTMNNGNSNNNINTIFNLSKNDDEKFWELISIKHLNQDEIRKRSARSCKERWLKLLINTANTIE